MSEFALYDATSWAGELAERPSTINGAIYVATDINALYIAAGGTWHLIPQSLDDLDDVLVAGKSAGDILQWDGADWIDFDLLDSNNTFSGANTFSGINTFSNKNKFSDFLRDSAGTDTLKVISTGIQIGASADKGISFSGATNSGNLNFSSTLDALVISNCDLVLNSTQKLILLDTTTLYMYGMISGTAAFCGGNLLATFTGYAIILGALATGGTEFGDVAGDCRWRAGPGKQHLWKLDTTVEMIMDASILAPNVADGLSLGDATHEWQDLYFTPPDASTDLPVLMIETTNQVCKGPTGWTGTFPDRNNVTVTVVKGIITGHP